MKSFETTLGPKQGIRESLVQVALAHIVQVKKIFTLPGKECLCVNTFKQTFPQANIRAVERVKEDWESIIENNVDCTLGTVQDYANQITRPTMHHDIIFLDYFSFLNKDVLTGIKSMIQNSFILHRGKKAILGITLMKAIRQEKDDMLDFINENVYLSKGVVPENTLAMVGHALHCWINRENQTYLQKVELLDSKEYRASETSTPMYFYTFLIEK